MTATETTPVTSTCVRCETAIEHEDGIGWVDVRSGDDGGTYDRCPEPLPDGPHDRERFGRHVPVPTVLVFSGSRSGYGVYGVGRDEAEAMHNARRKGAVPSVRGYNVVTLPEGAVLKGVDEVGRVHYHRGTSAEGAGLTEEWHAPTHRASR